MIIRLGSEELVTQCLGPNSTCMCHVGAIQMGDGLNDGCCQECGCPKTPEAWRRMKAEEHLGD